jgi:hypothetical protein
MKISHISTGLLLASAATTSKNQAEAGLPMNQFAAGARGLCTGAISAGVKNIFLGIQAAAEGSPQNQVQTQPSNLATKALKNFPVSFGATAVATTLVDKLFAVPPATSVNHVQQLALPIASMVITKEILSHSEMPPQVKEALSYGAFWGGRLVQGKNPVTSAVAISGFAAGASLIKSLSNNTSQANSVGVSKSAASGFMAPDSSKGSEKASVESYDRYIKERYGMNQDDKFWGGPDGSLFIPISDKEFKGSTQS